VTYSGFFELKTPHDLLAKLRRDFKRIESSNRLDADPAFDFFVAAHHMLDWVYPGDSGKEARRKEVQASPLLQVCSHLANGSKHFQAKSEIHKAVADTQPHAGQFSDQFSDEFDVDRLEVLLQDGSVKTVKELAREVLTFWETHPSLAL
jgi:hypothetical protein